MLKRFLLYLLLLVPLLVSGQTDAQKKKVLFDWWLSSSQGYPKKDNLLVFITPAQSNAGSIDDGTQQETGSVPYANIPARLATPPANVDFVKHVASTLSIAPMEVLNTNEWGWLNQFIHVIAGSWDDIIYCKKSLGGSTLLSGGLGNYPRADFKARATVAIAEANSRWGAGNYNIVYIAGIGETNALSAANADDWLPAMQEYIDADLRINYADGPIVVIKKGKYQVVDFPYIVSNLWAAQDAYVATNTRTNFMTEGEGALWELLDTPTADDYSHYNAAGSITMGNAVADKVLEIFSATKSDATAPTLVSAVVENAAPSNIVLTYSKDLDASVIPFWKDFTPSGNRIVNTVAVSGATVTLTVSEPYYTGQTITLSYTKKQHYENTIVDPYGNEAAAFTGQAVTNNVSTAVPTYTTVYTSDFSVDVNGWTGISGGVPARIASWDGQSNVLECGSSDATPIINRNSMFANTTNRHIVDFDIWIPTDYGSSAPSNDYSIIIDYGVGGLFHSNLYNYTRRNVLGGQWIHLQCSGIPANTGAMRFNVANITSGDKFYLKNIVVKRVN